MIKKIPVLKTPKSAYNPKRKVSSLLKAHVINLEAAVARKLGTKTAKKPRTEGQASAYIADLTDRLHTRAPLEERQGVVAVGVDAGYGVSRTTTRHAGKRSRPRARKRSPVRK